MAETISAESSTGAMDFVARAREIAELRGDLDEASRRRDAFFLITGEAGIGKTRLAAEVAAEAATRGVKVLWCRCWGGRRTPAPLVSYSANRKDQLGDDLSNPARSSSENCLASDGTAMPDSLGETHTWIALEISTSLSSDPALIEIVSDGGSDSCQSREPQVGQNAHLILRPLSVPRLQNFGSP